jgi:glutamate N-acetyltransferase/amino-acid N-acetyltransferase
VSVTHAKGFLAAGLEIGLKNSGGKDLAIVQNVGPRKAAAVVFTGNRAQANPIIWSKQVIADGVVEAIILNSGGANC